MSIIHDESQHKFFIQLLDGEAFLRYTQRERCLHFVHTFVPEAGRNKGVAEQVVLAGFRYAQANGFTVVPTCPYVAHAFLRRHPEFQSIVSSAC